MRSVLLRLVLASFAAVSAWANGGPVAEGVTSTGDGTLLAKGAKTSVSIEEEDLTIDLQQEFAEVRLRYRMRNAGGAVAQDFFYPVETWEGDVDRYAITADGTALQVTTVDAKGAAAKVAKLKQRDMGEENEKAPAPIQRWRKSVIPFSAGQTREILIRYRSAYAENGSDVSDDVRRDARYFAYRLSPAAAWKNPIGRGKVTVNLRLPEPENVVIEKPSARFHQVSPTQWEWTFRDLRPTQADDLRIVTQPAYVGYGRTLPLGDPREDAGANSAFYRIVGPRAFVEHSNYAAVASSTLKPGKSGQTYGVENLRQRFGAENTWAEGVDGDGIGESLTLTVKDPLPLDALLVRPGFYHSEKKDLWTANNRVATCEITLNDEHTFTAEIPDERFREPYPIPVRGYAKPVKTVRLIIKAVHRGTQFRDTCISYVGLRAKLASVPKIQGAR